ncbi:MAG TPA: RNA polymerase sigma factor [Bacilli bacterium]|nr:RNA polymerase sigma factor [Bacilli bacterium]
MGEEQERAFRELYDAYYADVYRYVYHAMQDKADVEDMVQEVFWQAYRSFASFRGDCEYKTWLFSIAHNRLNSMWRTFFRRKKIAAQYEQAARAEAELMQSGDGDVERVLLAQELEREMDRLPPHYREVVTLRYLHDFSVADTGRVLGMTDAKVRLLTHRAILKLRENWSEGEGGPMACKIDSGYLKA